MFNKYPYTDFHELNTDWILSQIIEYTKLVDELNTKVDELRHDIEENYYTKTEVSNTGIPRLVVNKNGNTMSLDIIAGKGIIDSNNLKLQGDNIYVDAENVIDVECDTTALRCDNVLSATANNLVNIASSDVLTLNSKTFAQTADTNNLTGNNFFTIKGTNGLDLNSNGTISSTSNGHNVTANSYDITAGTYNAQTTTANMTASDSMEISGKLTNIKATNGNVNISSSDDVNIGTTAGKVDVTSTTGITMRGNTLFVNDVTVQGDTELEGLEVNNATVMHGTVSINDILTTNKINTNDIDISGATNINGSTLDVNTSGNINVISLADYVMNAKSITENATDSTVNISANTKTSINSGTITDIKGTSGVDVQSANVVLATSDSNYIEVNSDGITILTPSLGAESTGEINLTGDTGATLEGAESNIILGDDVSVKAKQKLTANSGTKLLLHSDTVAQLDATSSATVSGAVATISGSGEVNIESGENLYIESSDVIDIHSEGNVDINGAYININEPSGDNGVYISPSGVAIKYGDGTNINVSAELEIYGEDGVTVNGLGIDIISAENGVNIDTTDEGSVTIKANDSLTFVNKNEFVLGFDSDNWLEINTPKLNVNAGEEGVNISSEDDIEISSNSDIYINGSDTVKIANSGTGENSYIYLDYDTIEIESKYDEVNIRSQNDGLVSLNNDGQVNVAGTKVTLNDSVGGDGINIISYDGIRISEVDNNTQLKSQIRLDETGEIAIDSEYTNGKDVRLLTNNTHKAYYNTKEIATTESAGGTWAGDVLWTNPSPAARMATNATIATISTLKSYKYIAIEYRGSVLFGYESDIAIFPTADNTKLVLNGVEGTSATVGYRSISISGNVITSTNASGDQWCVPAKIYGIK